MCKIGNYEENFTNWQCSIIPIQKSSNIRKVDREVKDVNLEIMVTNAISEIGVPAHIKGYLYLREAIILVLMDPAAISSVTKTIYPTIGKKFNTTAYRVDRALRHAIKVAWTKGNPEYIKKYFRYRMPNNIDSPTNSEFIATIADRLKLKIRFDC